MSRYFAVLTAFAFAATVAACNQQSAQPVRAPAPAPAVAETSPPPVTAPAPPPAPVAEAASTQPEVTVTGFKHDPANDMFGYYMPSAEVKIGKWTLSNIAIGTPSDFVKYEKGERDPPEYAPVLIEFYDDTSPQVENENGGSEFTGQRRVLPAAYSVADGKLQFAGDDPQLGHVTFSGTIDVAAVKRATAAMSETGGGGDSVVLKGDLTVGDKVLRNLQFTWFGGD